MKDKKEQTNSFLKYSGLGLQLLLSIGLAAWVGLKLDRYFELEFPAFLLILVEMASAQYVLNSTSNGTTVNTCSGTFYDSGGSGSNYSGNQNYTITFCGTSGCLMASFTSFNTQAGNDVLSVYDGSNTSAPLLGTFSGNSVPADLIASSGCLTRGGSG